MSRINPRDLSAGIGTTRRKKNLLFAQEEDPAWNLMWNTRWRTPRFTYLDIAARVDDEGGICFLRMEALRDTEGAGSLGKHVVKRISRSLHRHDLRHYPRKLPTHGPVGILVFRKGSLPDLLFQAAELPPSKELATVLRSLLVEGRPPVACS